MADPERVLILQFFNNKMKISSSGFEPATASLKIQRRWAKESIP